MLVIALGSIDTGIVEILESRRGSLVKLFNALHLLDLLDSIHFT